MAEIGGIRALVLVQPIASDSLNETHVVQEAADRDTLLTLSNAGSGLPG
jgi:hypothetical protein